MKVDNSENSFQKKKHKKTLEIQEAALAVNGQHPYKDPGGRNGSHGRAHNPVWVQRDANPLHFTMDMFSIW